MRERRDLSVDDVADRVARRFARKVFWADPEDLHQEARVAALTASRPGGPYSPECGVPLTAYVHRACVLHLRAWCLRNSAPVSDAHHALDALKRVCRSDLDPTMLDPKPLPDALYVDAERRKRIREQVRFILNVVIDDHAVACERVIVDEEQPRDVAAAYGIPLREFYRIVQTARAALQENNLLYRMWRRA